MKEKEKEEKDERGMMRRRRRMRGGGRENVVRGGSRRRSRRSGTSRCPYVERRGDACGYPRPPLVSNGPKKFLSQDLMRRPWVFRNLGAPIFAIESL